MVKKLETSLTTEFTTLPSPTLRLAYCPLYHAYSGQGRAEQIARDRHMDWKTLLAYITGTVDQELLLRNEYLVTENQRIGRTFQCGEGWHSNEKTVRFWIPS